MKGGTQGVEFRRISVGIRSYRLMYRTNMLGNITHVTKGRVSGVNHADIPGGGGQASPYFWSYLPTTIRMTHNNQILHDNPTRGEENVLHGRSCP